MISNLRAPSVPAAVLRRAAAALLVVSAAALLTACDKVPLTAPSNATIRLFSNTPIVPLNGTAQITATVTQGGGVAVHNGTVVSFTTSLGTIEPTDAETHDGKVTVTFRAGTQSGTAVINAYSGSAATTATGGTTTGTTGGTTGTTTTSGGGVTLLVGSAAAASVVVTAAPGTVSAAGGNSVITATVLDANNNPLPGVAVSFSTDVGTVSPVSATTDQNGQASTTLNTFQTATVTVTAGPKITGTAKVTATPVPTVTITAPTTTPTAKLPTTFSVNITPGSGGAPITRATIDFGDGTPVFNLGSASGTVSVSHMYDDEGTFSVTVSVTDATGQTVTSSIPITVFPQVPFTLTVTAPSAKVGNPVTITVTPNAGAPSIINYTWDFGDGSPRITTTANSIQHIYTFVPLGNQFIVQVTATGADQRTGSGSAVILITP